MSSHSQYPPGYPPESMGPAVAQAGAQIVDFDTLLATAPPLPPGGFRDTPFNNIRPRTRAEKRAAQDRERLEKDRLRSRRFGHQQYQDPGAVVAPATDPTVASYGDAANRFRRDFAAEEKERKAELHAKKQAELDRRRLQDAEREAARWAEMDARDAAERERLQQLRLDGGKARKNRSALPYDSVRMLYHGTPDGEALRAQDDALRRRAAVRASWIEEKAHSVHYDPITGFERSTAKSASHPGLHPSADGTLSNLHVKPLQIDPMGSIGQLVGTARSTERGSAGGEERGGFAAESRAAGASSALSSYQHQQEQVQHQHQHRPHHQPAPAPAASSSEPPWGTSTSSSRKADSPWAPSNLASGSGGSGGGEPSYSRTSSGSGSSGGDDHYHHGGGRRGLGGGSLAASGRMALGGGGGGYEPQPQPQHQHQFQQPQYQQEQQQQQMPPPLPSGRARLRAEMQAGGGGAWGSGAGSSSVPSGAADYYGQPPPMPASSSSSSAWGSAEASGIAGGGGAWGGRRR